jgi:hypothetical protein
MENVMAKFFIREPEAPDELIEFLDEWRKPFAWSRKAAVLALIREKMELERKKSSKEVYPETPEKIHT